MFKKVPVPFGQSGSPEGAILGPQKSLI